MKLIMQYAKLQMKLIMQYAKLQIINSVSNSKLLFREVFKLTRIFLTLPVTTATAERTFSTLRHLKTFALTLSQPNLNHCMLLHAHKDSGTNC